MRGDMNRDGQFTISDIGLLIREMFFFPGNALIDLLGNTGLGHFFEIAEGHRYGWLAGLLSFGVLAALVVSSALLEGWQDRLASKKAEKMRAVTAAASAVLAGDVAGPTAAELSVDAKRFVDLFERYCRTRDPDTGQAAIDLYLASKDVRDDVRANGWQLRVTRELELPAWLPNRWPVRR